MEEEKWLQTDQYLNFHCKEGDCRNSCCEGWQIAVSMQDYFRVIGMECSEELHRKVECAFRVPQSPSPQRYRLISPNYLGRCPLHDESGLCMLHRDLGPESLPEICRMYPRNLKQFGDERRACCSNSCEAVIEDLMRDAPVQFIWGKMDAAPECAVEASAAELALGRECAAILQREEIHIGDRLARVCGRLSGREFEVRADRMQAGLWALLDALKVEMENVESLRHYGADALNRYGGGDSAALCRYREDLKCMESAFPAWARWFENILLNHFFYENLPCADARLSAADVCHGLCLLFGAMRALSAAYLIRHPGQADFADVLAGIFRAVEHSPFYYNARVLVAEPENLLAL